MNYSYRRFHDARDPRLVVDDLEYRDMRVNLNGFMHDMLETLKQDEDLLGKAVRFKKWHLMAFFLLTLASVAGGIFLEHPGWISFSWIFGAVMAVAVLAVPITYLQDGGKYQRQRNVFIREVKSYYMFHFSLMRNVSSYDEYAEKVPEADTGIFLKYLDKYKD